MATALALFAALGASATASAASRPSVESESLSNITPTDATYEAQINPGGLETTYEVALEAPACEAGACESAPEIRIAGGTIPAGSSAQAVSVDIAQGWGHSLSPGTCYRVGVRVTNAAGEEFAENNIEVFETPAGASPSIEAESVSSITATEATLEAEINPQGLPGVEYQFQLVANTSEYLPELVCAEWGVVAPVGQDGCLDPPEWPSGTIPLRTLFGGEAAKSVSLDLASVGVALEPGTTYHYRVLAAASQNGEDTVGWEPPAVIGPDQTFTTPPAPPSVESESVSNITPTGATLEAQINSNRRRFVFYQFQLVKDPSEYLPELACPEERVQAEGIGDCHFAPTPVPGALPIGRLNEAGSEARSVSQDLAAADVTLQPGTTYHYRLLAVEGEFGEEGPYWEENGPFIAGSDQTFTTPSPSEPSPSSAQTGGTASQLPATISPPAASPPRHRHHRHRHRGNLHRARQRSG